MKTSSRWVRVGARVALLRDNPTKDHVLSLSRGFSPRATLLGPMG